MTASPGAEVLLGLARGEKPTEAAQIGANLFTGLGLLANSRSDKAEADAYSFRYLQSTPYYPWIVRFFFDKILASSAQRGGMFERLLSTHPLPQDRVENVKKMLAQIGDPKQTETQLFTQRDQIMKRRLP
jgi:predicted Zn-dependent protease